MPFQPREGAPETRSPADPLAKHLCRVVGLNQNYSSKSGTQYHIQIEDRGPVLDPLLETEVRRVNVIVYANYGEPNARIIHGRDHDFPDARTQQQNRFIEEKIQSLAADAREVILESENRLVRRIKNLIAEYHQTKSEVSKREFEEANAIFPFLFSRAWAELKQERQRPAADPDPVAVSDPASEPIRVDVVYPLEGTLRDQVLEIEHMLEELMRDLESLRSQGRADDIIVQTCRKLVARAEENLRHQGRSDFNARRLEMTRTSLLTTWKQLRSRLR